ncbi:hypothetical protein OpiT1DRAFT_05684 [Opitutaceae bacterium TAV1]|nr:hypothetical protein OpiT1DRAFT_05684 [Opitutaceae bacterium TAV1]
MITVGIDNGSTGSIGILRDSQCVHFGPVPVQDYLHYGKKGSIGKRLDRGALRDLIYRHVFLPVESAALRDGDAAEAVSVFIERPFSGRFVNAVVPAHRFFEATIIVMEDVGLGYEVIDSGVWQKPVLGAGVTGSADLKKASRLRGIQVYPQLTDAIKKHGDADGLLIAHHFHHRT